MTVTTNFFEQPRFRDNVSVDPRDTHSVIRIRDQEYEVDLAPHARNQSTRLLELLKQGGHTLPQLQQECPALGEEIPELLRDFDRLGLLTETSLRPVSAMPGRQFYRELRRYVRAIIGRGNTRPFLRGMLEGTVNREQLIGFALEYFHVVNLCPGLLGPALAHHEPRRSRKLLQDFFASELRHDEMLARSLGAVGIGLEALETMVPLPMTFAVCSSLGVYARQHPLSFKAVLFLFEAPDGDFNQAFRERCLALGLPRGFYEPILQHARVNEAGEHDQISEVLFEEVPLVNPEDQLVVKRHAGLLAESLLEMERQLLEYYGRPGSQIPRCFA
jgi:hypothetical protein